MHTGQKTQKWNYIYLPKMMQKLTASTSGHIATPSGFYRITGDQIKSSVF